MHKIGNAWNLVWPKSGLSLIVAYTECIIDLVRKFFMGPVDMHYGVASYSPCMTASITSVLSIATCKGPNLYTDIPDFVHYLDTYHATVAIESNC